jgi:hypothetical protein
MAALKAVVLAGPDPAVDKIVRWRVVDLCRWVEERWGVSYSETGMLRVLWSLDLSHRKCSAAIWVRSQRQSGWEIWHRGIGMIVAGQVSRKVFECRGMTIRRSL